MTMNKQEEDERSAVVLAALDKCGSSSEHRKRDRP